MQRCPEFLSSLLLMEIILSAGMRVHMRGQQQSFSSGAQGKQLPALSPQYAQQHNHPQRHLLLEKTVHPSSGPRNPLREPQGYSYLREPFINAQEVWPSQGTSLLPPTTTPLEGSDHCQVHPSCPEWSNGIPKVPQDLHFLPLASLPWPRALWGKVSTLPSS